MFSKVARDIKNETQTLFAYFQLITPRANECWIKYTLLERKKIDISIVKNALDRLDLFYDDSDATQFKVLISYEKFAKILDEAYPSEGKASANNSSSQATTVVESKISAINNSSIAKSKSAPSETNLSSVAQPDPITVRCQSILNNCQTKNRNGERPLFTGEAQQAMLMNYVRQALSTLDVKREDETKNQFDTRIRVEGKELKEASSFRLPITLS